MDPHLSATYRSKPYRYRCCCINCSDVSALNQMIELAKSVTYRTMLRHCEGLLEWARNQGYSRSSNQGLTIQNDFHVSYWKSIFQGHPCYYLCWSAIEYIWTLE